MSRKKYLTENMFGDPVDPKDYQLVCKAEPPHLCLFRNNKIIGMVSKNGWTGKSATIRYRIGEPVLHLYADDDELSLAEMKQIQAAWANMQKTVKKKA